LHPRWHAVADFTNYLDRANLANAYVSGMKEEVGFLGNDYTYAGSMFTAGYVIGQWPSALVLSSGRIPPRFWFPFCMVVWGFLTLGLACERDHNLRFHPHRWPRAVVHTPHQVWGIRFVCGIFEASTFSGTHYILGSWYKDRELGKRSAVFATAAQVGSLFSGIMQGAIISTLEGRSGLRGWQWLFVIDFCITSECTVTHDLKSPRWPASVPIAIYGFAMFPDTPHTTKACE
jgi:ACS family pantothenate transporter-like MFS transporter